MVENINGIESHQHVRWQSAFFFYSFFVLGGKLRHTWQKRGREGGRDEDLFGGRNCLSHRRLGAAVDQPGPDTSHFKNR